MSFRSSKKISSHCDCDALDDVYERSRPRERIFSRSLCRERFVFFEPFPAPYLAGFQRIDEPETRIQYFHGFANGEGKLVRALLRVAL